MSSEMQERTVSELLTEVLLLPHEKQEQWVDQVQITRREATACWQRDHEGRIEELTRQRDEALADLEAMRSGIREAIASYQAKQR